MNCPNSTTTQQPVVEGFTLPPDAPQPIERVGDRASSGHGFSHAVQTRPQKASPFARLFDSPRLRRASARYSPCLFPPSGSKGIMSTSDAKLDFHVSQLKSITSIFLIDNSCTHSWSQAFPASSFQPPASRNSNRHIPELETGLSHRKQSIGPLSNRHKFAFCQRAALTLSAVEGFIPRLPLPASLPSSSHSQLSTLYCKLPFLIANDLHSREESSNWKQSTYSFLIANEFHTRISSLRRGFRHSKAPTASVAARTLRCDNCAGKANGEQKRGSLAASGEDKWD